MNLLCSSFKVYKPKNGSQGVSKAASFLEAPGENLFLYTFQLLQAAYIPWIMALFFHLQSQQQLMGFFLHLIPPPPPPRSGSSASSTFKDSDHTESVQIIQANLPTLRSVN